MSTPPLPVESAKGQQAGGQDTPHEHVRHYLDLLLLPVALALAIVALLAWSWNKWGDFYIDYGVTIYAPWQLSKGKMLYRDIMWIYGPLAPYMEALLFRIFGTARFTLLAYNFALGLGILALSYRLIKAASGRLVAVVSAFVLICVFMFSHTTRLGNYNYFVPYCNEALLGTALCVLLTFLLFQWFAKASILSMLGAGVSSGLVYLVKPELSLASMLITCVALAITLAIPDYRARGAKPWIAFTGCAVAPFVIALLLFSLAMPLAHAWRSANGAWWLVLHSNVPDTPAMREQVGLDNPAGNARDMAVTLASFVALLAFVFTCDWWLSKRKWNEWKVVVPIAAAIALWIVLSNSISFPKLARVLPAVSAAALGVTGFVLLRRRDGNRRVKLVALCLWSALSVGMIARMFLHPRFQQYGFVQAMPATLLLVLLLLDVAPALLNRVGAQGRFWQAVYFVFIATGTLHSLYESNHFYRAKTCRIGHDGDAMLIDSPARDSRTPVFKQALNFLDKVPRSATVACFPQGALLNYFTRHDNPTPFFQFTPSEVLGFGEDTMIRAFQKTPPDYVLILDLRTGTWEWPGTYGKNLDDWVRSNYERVQLIGAEPFKTKQPGIEILRRKP